MNQGMSLKDRQVAETRLSSDVRVSTVFLDLKYEPDEPQKWETLIIGGPYNDEGEQYTSVEDARAGHELWVMVARGELTPEAIHEMREVTLS